MNKYMEIRQTILQEIFDGMYPEGEMLPSEKTLAQRFGVSRMTVRHALEGLKEERCITTRHGYGSVIRNKPSQVSTDLSRLESIEAMIRASGKKLKELSRSIETGHLNGEEANMLFCDKGTSFSRLIRLRSIDEVPVALTINVFSEKRTPANLETFKGSLLSLLEQTGEPINYAETRIMIPRPDDINAKVLRVNNKAAPIAVCRQLHFNWEHHPIFLSYDYLNLNVFPLSVTRKKL